MNEQTKQGTNVENKYLYSILNFKQGVSRHKIYRETDCYYFLYVREDYEIKVPKKTMRTGGNYEHTYYYVETEELRDRYVETRIRVLFQRRLEELKKCTDIEIMKKVLSVPFTLPVPVVL
jgi:hypothetical protein